MAMASSHEDVPELSIAVIASRRHARGSDDGSSSTSSSASRAEGHAALSLSVSREHAAARHLYDVGRLRARSRSTAGSPATTGPHKRPRERTLQLGSEVPHRWTARPSWPEFDRGSRSRLVHVSVRTASTAGTSGIDPREVDVGAVDPVLRRSEHGSRAGSPQSAELWSQRRRDTARSPADLAHVGLAGPALGTSVVAARRSAAASLPVTGAGPRSHPRRGPRVTTRPAWAARRRTRSGAHQGSLPSACPGAGGLAAARRRSGSAGTLLQGHRRRCAGVARLPPESSLHTAR